MPKDLIYFWNVVWKDRRNPIIEYIVQRDANRIDYLDIPDTARVLHGLPLGFTETPVLIRDEYEIACSALEDLQPTTPAVIIVGHPGIGTTFCLAEYSR